MLIPYDLLQADTLQGLLEDFVTREGTDNGDDTPLDVRVQRAQRALQKGEAVILFDPESQQCQLMLRSEVPRELLDRGPSKASRLGPESGSQKKKTPA